MRDRVDLHIDKVERAERRIISCASDLIMAKLDKKFRRLSKVGDCFKDLKASVFAYNKLIEDYEQ